MSLAQLRWGWSLITHIALPYFDRPVINRSMNKRWNLCVKQVSPPDDLVSSLEIHFMLIYIFCIIDASKVHKMSSFSDWWQEAHILKFNTPQQLQSLPYSFYSNYI